MLIYRYFCIQEMLVAASWSLEIVHAWPSLRSAKLVSSMSTL